MSKLNKLIWFARRFNTLIPLGVTIVVFGLIAYGIVSVIKTPTKPQTTVASTPNMEKIEEDGTIFDLVRETGFRGNSAKADDLFILKLVAKRKTGRGYENEFRYGIRNLLHVNERTGEGRWLFPSQQQVIRSQEIQIDGRGREDAQYLQTIQHIIHSSDQIGVLGFGFDAVNVDRIFGGIAFASPENRKKMFATTKGMTEAESKAAMLQINKRDLSIYQNASLMQKDCDCTTLLRESLILS